MSSAVKKRKQIDLPVAQFVAVIVLTVSIFLIVDFGRRAAAGYRYSQEEVRLQAQLAKAKATQEWLLAKRDYINTDAYVEEVARNELKWSRPNETVVVIMPSFQPKAQPVASRQFKTQSDPFSQPFQAWIALFFPGESTIPLGE